MNMKKFTDLNKMQLKENTAVALGAFDGLHLGHRAVISKVRGTQFVPSVFTFIEDPSKLLEGGTEYIMTRQDKEYELSEMGIINLFSVNFDEIKNMSAEEFFTRILIEKCRAKVISCGENFRFGHKADGDIKCLHELCERYEVELRVTPPVTLDGETVSSTCVREALRRGDMMKAARLLGRPFGFTLPVVTGNQIGRTLGTPTINQVLPEGFVKPRFGVYAAIVHIGKNRHWGVCNIGTKPTVGKYDPLAETWIGEFSGDLYGNDLKLEILDFIRPERKFGSLDELKQEIEKNAEAAKKIVEKYLEENI